MVYQKNREHQASQMNWEVIGLEMDIKKAVIRIELEPFPGCKEKAFIETQFGQVKSSIVYELVKTV